MVEEATVNPSGAFCLIKSRIAGWYIYNVCVDLLQEMQRAEISPSDSLISSLGNEFVKNDKAVKSLMR